MTVALSLNGRGSADAAGSSCAYAVSKACRRDRRGLTRRLLRYLTDPLIEIGNECVSPINKKARLRSHNQANNTTQLSLIFKVWSCKLGSTLFMQLLALN